MNEEVWARRLADLKREINCDAAAVYEDRVTLVMGRYRYDIDVPIIQSIVESYEFVVTNGCEMPAPYTEGEFRIWPMFSVRFRRPA